MTCFDCGQRRQKGYPWQTSEDGLVSLCGACWEKRAWDAPTCNDCGRNQQEVFQWRTPQDKTLLICDACWQKRGKQAGTLVKVGTG